jgi:CBS domain-containing protein
MSPLLCPVADLMQTQLLRCPESESLGVALSRMQSARVGSILIDCADASCGILTRNDLIDRVILPRKNLDASVSSVMSHPVRMLPVESSALDAMEAMMRWRVRHLPLVCGGEIVGLLSEHDLLRQLRNSPDRLMLSIERARDEAQLVSAAAEAANVARQLHRELLPALQIARIMSLLNDALTRQAIGLVVSTAAVDQRWAWVALGSEARAEQTVVTDQDNALILGDAPGFAGGATGPHAEYEGVASRAIAVGGNLESEPHLGHGPAVNGKAGKRSPSPPRKIPAQPRARHAVQGLARRVNELLDRMGFPLCKGGVMAMNDPWCKTLGEWTEEIQGWLLRPNPEAVLKASIALDFRWLAGDRALVDQLEARVGALLEGAGNNRRIQVKALAARGFLQALAASILERKVQPIPSEGMLALREWIGGFGSNSPNALVLLRDLKLHGTSLIVDAVRFLALAHLERHAWIPHSTVDRIGWLEKREVLRAGEAASLRDAFENLTALRLEQQLTRSSDSDNQSANVVDLLALNSNQRWMLRKHLQSVESLRDKVRLDFGGRGVFGLSNHWGSI